jgi:hypothetical protein
MNSGPAFLFLYRVKISIAIRIINTINRSNCPSSEIFLLPTFIVIILKEEKRLCMNSNRQPGQYIAG